MAEKIKMVKIADLRKSNNMSQLDLAENMMESLAEIQKWERLQPNLPGSAIMRLAISFGVPPHDIIGAKGIEFDPYSDEYL